MLQSVGVEDDGLKSQRLDCIYDDEPLSFEKDHVTSVAKMQPQDLLDAVDLGDGIVKRSTLFVPTLTQV